MSSSRRLRREVLHLFILLIALIVIGGTLFQIAMLLPITTFDHVRLFVVIMLISGLFLSGGLIVLTKILELRADILKQAEI